MLRLAPYSPLKKANMFASGFPRGVIHSRAPNVCSTALESPNISVSTSRCVSSVHLSPRICYKLKRTFRGSAPLYCTKSELATRTSVMSSNVYTLKQPQTGNNNDVLNFKILKYKLEEVGIVPENLIPGESCRIVCPQCKGGSVEDKSLDLTIGDDWKFATWICLDPMCGWSGRTMPCAGSQSTYTILKNLSTSKQKHMLTIESLHLQQLCNEIINYFAQRMISKETLLRNRVMQRICYDQPVIAFTYWDKEDLVCCKYRDQKKVFWQEKDTRKIFYGLDDIRDAKDIIIVEGEIDKLSLEEAGFRNCVSVPDGAPSSVSKNELPSEEKDTKYQYIWNCKDYLSQASRIILATDSDPPGQALAEEIARRVGKEKCWRVKWPKKNDTENFKDANEVLQYMGPEALKEAVENAELYPILGLFNFRSYYEEIDAYYHRNSESDIGVSTGWASLDSLYNVVPGELTVITGVPNSGKSEWIDALMCNLNSSFGWTFALCSMENRVRDHGRKLLEKHIKKPFFDMRYGESIERMSVEELERGKEWLNNTFYLIRCEDDALPSINWVLSMAKVAVMRHGVRGLVIDPYNELDHQRPKHMTETEYVSQMLTIIKRFAQHHSCHVWFVAHPRQLQQWVGGPPNLYDISGSAHFINKCDNGLVVHRNRDPAAGPLDQVQICVRKVRNKVAGTIGEAFLSYDRITGLFSDIY